MIEREEILLKIRKALGRSRVVLLSGPRQCGKTTLAREFVREDSVNYFDLEDPASIARLDEPMTALRPLKGLVVIDEVQRRPDLFPILRVLADRIDKPATFLILGSASGDLLRQSSESLAGRLEKLIIGGFSLREVGAERSGDLWLRGGLPIPFLSTSLSDSSEWRDQFISTLLERDFPQWGVRVSATALRRFWTMLAHYHGQIWNAGEPARALAITQPTVRKYLDLLTDAFMIRQLSPWYENLSKRQVKSPKVYVRDSGLLHQLLGISEEKDLLTHPKVGASWEGFAIEQVLSIVEHQETYFWATHQGAEIDLMLVRGNRKLGIECKRADAPQINKSIRIALKDLDLEHLFIIYPGNTRFPLSDHVTAVPISDLATREFSQELNAS
ncbi:MAG: ATP-binding protein [Acidobacteriota bacterium]|nr:MAG: ATP-binding protein [Acidobacteriota bacterium]